MNTLEAYDLVVFASQFHQKLVEARARLDDKPEAIHEKTWLAAAVEILGEAIAEATPRLARAKALPELRPIREESAAEVIGLWVDALEKLHAGITFHAGSRTPLLQALFVHAKFPQLRKASFEAADEYAKELERRMKTSYVERMLLLEEFAFARPILEQATSAFDAVAATRADVKMHEEEARALTDQLLVCAKDVELVLLQARLLAQAALAPFPGAFEEAGLSAKPKKRAVKSAEAAEDAVAEVVEAPADPEDRKPKRANAKAKPTEEGAPAPKKQKRPRSEAKPIETQAAETEA